MVTERRAGFVGGEVAFVTDTGRSAAFVGAEVAYAVTHAAVAFVGAEVAATVPPPAATSRRPSPQVVG